MSTYNGNSQLTEKQYHAIMFKISKAHTIAIRANDPVSIKALGDCAKAILSEYFSTPYVEIKKAN